MESLYSGDCTGRMERKDVLRSTEACTWLVPAMFQQSQVRCTLELETSQLKQEFEYEPLFQVRRLLYVCVQLAGHKVRV